jgi:hypothetical protein
MRTMTGSELRDLFMSQEFQEGLGELSSYLASIMQERPIVHLLAKCLWKQGHKFELESEKQDLNLYGRRIEFKFNWDKCQEALANELDQYGDNIPGMWQLVQAGKISKSWSVMARIYEDTCVRKPKTDIFVWIICSRDLRRVAPDDLNRICLASAQCNYNAAHPYMADDDQLAVVDSFLQKLQAVRPFSLLKQSIPTNGDFPSTYHFRICDFQLG